VRERRCGLDSRNGAAFTITFSMTPKNLFLPRKRHFEIELGEFRLAVGAQVFVAETFDDLEVTVQAANHQDLFEDLRRTAAKRRTGRDARGWGQDSRARLRAWSA